MNKRQCGQCKLDINDLEPIRCCFCDTFYHISAQCTGFNSRGCKELLASGKLQFICTLCRNKLNGMCVEDYINNALNQPCKCSHVEQNLIAIVDKLTAVASNIKSTVEQLPIVHQPEMNLASTVNTEIWPRIKHPRLDNAVRNELAPDRGTKTLDLSDLSVPCITSSIQPRKFWLHLSGFNPNISDDDMRVIILRCLNTNENIELFRLVPKGKDISSLSFLSFKIGVDPSLKQLALNPATWPVGILLREFVARPKNSIQLTPHLNLTPVL